METYGSYQLIKRLATGGMAQIYLARQKGPEGFEKLLVVKRILPHLAENADFVRMFLDEARIAARLNHPNIVQIFNLGAQDDSYFIAMEYIHGEDVRRVWKRSEQKGTVMPTQLVCRVIMEACAGLDYAHKKADQAGKPLGIVHRDVSPQNILVTFEGGVKVVDFGIAKAADQAVVTRSGVLKGKYSYMSPEQALGKKLDHRSDIFALGVVLYELLTGTRLFKRANDIQTLNAVTECNVPPPSEVDEDIPKDLDEVVLKALAKEPQDRFEHAIDLQMALEEWLLKHQLPSSSAHLASFMQELYAERLAEEKAAGQVLVEEIDSLGGKRADGSDGEDPLGPQASSSPSMKKSRSFKMTDAVAESAPPLPPPPAMDRKSRSIAAPVLMARPATKDPERTEEVPPDQPAYLGDLVKTTATPPGRFLGLAEDRRETGESAAFSGSGTTTDSGAPYTVDERGRGGNRKAPPKAPSVPIIPIAAVVAALVVMGGAAWFALRPGKKAPGDAIVRIVSEPEGATVLFNNRPLPEPTPCQLPKSPGGQYPLVVGKRGYLDLHTTVTVPETGEMTLGPLRLEPDKNQQPSNTPGPPVVTTGQTGADAGAGDEALKVELTLRSEPSGAAIFLDGEPAGRTPRTFLLVANSDVSVRLDYPGYATLNESVHVGRDSSQEELLRLDRLGPNTKVAKGKVRFAVTPWANVSCGQYDLGATPFADKELPVGVYSCKFTHPEHGTRIERVEVKANSVIKVSVKF
jgi:eukaryotic-like serine/threonine-protein kinase